MAPRKKKLVWNTDITQFLNENEIWNSIADYKVYGEGETHDFYILIVTQSTKFIYLARTYCPDPDYDQSVFKYVYKDDAIRWLWSIPDQDTCFALINLLHNNLIHKDQKKLAYMCEAFIEGDLDVYVNKINRD